MTIKHITEKYNNTKNQNSISPDQIKIKLTSDFKRAGFVMKPGSKEQSRIVGKRNKMNPEKLQYGKFYHIYSHGVGMRNIFKEAENYEFFLDSYDKYIVPVADTFAWVLMPNHVHFVIRIKTEEEVAAFISDKVQNPVRGRNNKPIKIGTPFQQFSKLFNAYAQAFNKWTGAKDTLFE